MIAKYAAQCPTCGSAIVADVDAIVFDYAQRAWVHDNGKCRTNASLHTS